MTSLRDRAVRASSALALRRLDLKELWMMIGDRT